MLPEKPRHTSGFHKKVFMKRPITHAVKITFSVQDNTLHTQRVSNYYTLYSKRPIFRVQSGKKLHRTKKIYTDAVCGVCDKYEVMSDVRCKM